MNGCRCALIAENVFLSVSDVVLRCPRFPFLFRHTFVHRVGVTEVVRCLPCIHDYVVILRTVSVWFDFGFVDFVEVD